MNSRVRMLLAATLVLGAATALAASAPDTEPAPSLEEQLLQDLTADPLDDDVQRELFAPQDERPAPRLNCRGLVGGGEAEVVERAPDRGQRVVQLLQLG